MQGRSPLGNPGAGAGALAELRVRGGVNDRPARRVPCCERYLDPHPQEAPCDTP
jgi:hypothetical protein